MGGALSKTSAPSMTPILTVVPPKSIPIDCFMTMRIAGEIERRRSFSRILFRFARLEENQYSHEFLA